MSWKEWETKTIGELEDEVEKWRAEVDRRIEAYKVAEKDPNYGDVHLNERNQEIIEGGMVIHQMLEYIIERKAQRLGRHQLQPPPVIIKKPRFSPEELQKKIERGIIHISKHDYHLAISVFNALLLGDSACAPAYYHRGVAWFKSGKYQLAIDDFSAAIRLKPDYSEVYRQRAIAHGRLRQHQAQIDDLTQVIRLNPADAEAYYLRAGVYIELGDYAQALADCEQALKHRPDFALPESRIKEIHAKMAGT
jgi:tetratricopeptide (TPR) repeat protein